MKKKRKDAIAVMYRIQGGIGDNCSRRYIQVRDNQIFTDSLERDSTLYIGDAQHMAYFLKKRLDVKGRISDHIRNHMKIDELQDKEVEVIRMYLPEWFKYMLAATADQKEGRQRAWLPQLVDKTTPGDSYGISNWWVSLLKDACYYGETIEINNFYDVADLIMDDSIKLVYKKFRKLPECNIIKDIRKIDKKNVFDENIIKKLRKRNDMFLQDVFDREQDRREEKC